MLQILRGLIIVVRPHRMQSIKMRPIVTRGLCVSVRSRCSRTTRRLELGKTCTGNGAVIFA